MKTIHIETVIIGGGHAGVNLACWLEKECPNRDYLVLEKADTLLPQWKYARWDHFQVNTPVRFSTLYGEQVGDDETLDRPLQADLDRWEAHIEKMKIKYQLHSCVDKLAKNDKGEFEITVTVNNPDDSEKQVLYVSKNVVCANGTYQYPNKIKDETVAKKFPSIKQHASFGLKMSDLQPGGILIVGGGQTGVQLADLFAEHKTHTPVALCTSKIGGTPRSYRGRDVFFWMEQSKFIYMPKEALKGMPTPQAEGLRYGHNPITGNCKPISYISLHRKGVQLLGHLDSLDANEANHCQAIIKPGRAGNIKGSIDKFQKVMGMMIETAKTLEAEGQTFEPEEPEEEWELKTEDEKALLEEDGPLVFDLEEQGITNIVWATGSHADFDFLQIPEAKAEFDTRTKLPDDIKSASAPGLFFAGFPWIGTCQSSTLVNFDHDAKIIVDSLVR